MASKRVKFSTFVEKVEYELPTQSQEVKQTDSSNEYVKSSEDDAEEDSESISEGDSDIGSDQEDMTSGQFFLRIKRETKRAEKERYYLIKKLKSKSRVGSIFIDKVKRVVAAIQKEKGKFDFLIEWCYNA